MQTKKEDIEQRIIEVATDEFMKKGYENTSMRVIAYKANTSLGNIYHYFKNKDLLLQAMVLCQDFGLHKCKKLIDTN